MERDNIKDILIKRIGESPNGLNSLEFAREEHELPQHVVGSLKSLESSNIVVLKSIGYEEIEIGISGKEIIQRGSPEYIFKDLLSKTGGFQSEKDLITTLGEDFYKVCKNQSIRNKVISFDKATGNINFQEETFNSKYPGEDIYKKALKDFAELPYPEKHDAKLVKDLTQDKHIKIVMKSYLIATKGENFSETSVTIQSDLTIEQFKSGEWKKNKYKKFNYNAKGHVPEVGAFHPLMKARQQFREILLELGFQEMPTNKFVESSFWNFDALFTAQQHPARDTHDTFFLSNPKYSKVPEKSYFSKIKEVHEKGGYGSLGWRYDWSEVEACKNILRTHTTAVSSAMLFKLAKTYESTGKFTPVKYFSIDRVFRNESLDSTHLAEFHQVEGLIADYDIGLAELMGTIENFFYKVGIKRLRFKPAYNPYTEPSMEIFGYHEEKKKWVEIGNSGVFRPEMLLPMGLPENVNVIAWGLSLERPTMIHYKFNNIRDLFGHEVSLEDTKNSKIFCLNI